jgi:hypothetical protein
MSDRYQSAFRSPIEMCERMDKDFGIEYMIVGDVFNFIFNILWETGVELMIVYHLVNILFLLAYISLYYGFIYPMNRKTT